MSGRHRAPRGGVKTGETGPAGEQQTMGSGPAEMAELARMVQSQGPDQDPKPDQLIAEMARPNEVEPVADYFDLLGETAANLAKNSPAPPPAALQLIGRLRNIGAREHEAPDSGRSLLASLGQESVDIPTEKKARMALSNSISAAMGALAPSTGHTRRGPAVLYEGDDLNSPEALAVSLGLDKILGARLLPDQPARVENLGGGTRREILTTRTELDDVMMTSTTTIHESTEGSKKELLIELNRLDQLPEDETLPFAQYADLPEAYTPEGRLRLAPIPEQLSSSAAEQAKLLEPSPLDVNKVAPLSNFYDAIAEQTDKFSDVAYQVGVVNRRPTLGGNLRQMARGLEKKTLLPAPEGQINTKAEMQARNEFAEALRLAMREIDPVDKDKGSAPALIYGTDKADGEIAMDVTSALKEALGAQPLPTELFKPRRDSDGPPENLTVYATSWPEVMLYDIRERPGEGSVTPGQQKLALWRQSKMDGESMRGKNYVQPKKVSALKKVGQALHRLRRPSR